ncbi:hypothetical protein [Lichenifustis flavocetrariae]|uniref:Uncharacterized protein n=1 Tax=Lichenifustis flavocetrariae TaxID=2949735 RepID=A0AA41Z0T5_9HYPH|nr:hypothetical protein [Lichenifustis flavocetrariae]MCW6508350.1 hypothetical protein [Lichenifustis flavocetrariae]
MSTDLDAQLLATSGDLKQSEIVFQPIVGPETHLDLRGEDKSFLADRIEPLFSRDAQCRGEQVARLGENVATRRRRA